MIEIINLLFHGYTDTVKSIRLNIDNKLQDVNVHSCRAIKSMNDSMYACN